MSMPQQSARSRNTARRSAVQGLPAGGGGGGTAAATTTTTTVAVAGNTAAAAVSTMPPSQTASLSSTSAQSPRSGEAWSLHPLFLHHTPRFIIIYPPFFLLSFMEVYICAAPNGAPAAVQRDNLYGSDVRGEQPVRVLPAGPRGPLSATLQTRPPLDDGSINQLCFPNWCV